MKKLLKVMAAVAVIAVIACVLVACVPSNMDKAKSKMEDAGYRVDSTTWNRFDNIEGAFNATKINIAEGSGTLFALYFKDKDSAKKAYDQLTSEDKENLKQNGKWVYFGTTAAIEAFEK